REDKPKDTQVRSAGWERSLQDSICENLRHLLNSRCGMADACDDYGLIDPANIVRNMPEDRGKYEEAIRLCITKYEPRLTDVRVTQADSPEEPLCASFRITARL